MKTKMFWVLAITTCLMPLLFLEGCGGAVGLAAAGNRNNLNKIEIGMTKVEVREIMGKPHQREADTEYEWWSYLTHNSDPIYGIVYREKDFTPVAFKDGKLIGWGRNFYTDRTKKYDVKIDQKIKQE